VSPWRQRRRLQRRRYWTRAAVRYALLHEVSRRFRCGQRERGTHDLYWTCRWSLYPRTERAGDVGRYGDSGICGPDAARPTG